VAIPENPDHFWCCGYFHWQPLGHNFEKKGDKKSYLFRIIKTEGI